MLKRAALACTVTLFFAYAAGAAVVTYVLETPGVV